MKEKYGDAIEITFQKKFWPHIDKTGGFFMAKIKKLQKIESPDPRTLTTNTDISLYSGTLKNWEIKKDISLFQHKNSLLAVKNADIIKNILPKVYFMRLGENIGTIEKQKFSPNARSFRDLEVENFQKYTITSEEELDLYLRGNELATNLKNGYTLIEYDGVLVSIEKTKDGIISNSFPADWRRK